MTGMMKVHIKDVDPATLCPTCASRLVRQGDHMVCRNCRYDGNGEKVVQ